MKKERAVQEALVTGAKNWVWMNLEVCKESRGQEPGRLELDIVKCRLFPAGDDPVRVIMGIIFIRSGLLSLGTSWN